MKLATKLRRCQGGFTVLELGVAMTLTGILAVTLFSVFARTRRYTQKAVCMSNLKQLYQASKMYCLDHDRRLVPARVWTPGGTTLGVTWCVLLQPYMKDEQILTCPLDEAPQTARRSTDLPHSYGINYGLTYIAVGGGDLARRMSSVRNPSNVLLFFDMKPSAQAMGAKWTRYGSRVDPRHDGQASFAFLDGHVKSYPPEAVGQTMWVPAW